MSADASAWAWNAPLPAAQKMVLLCLADNFHDEDETPKTKPLPLTKLAARAGLTPEDVAQALRQLMEDGWIFRVAADTYTLNMPALAGR